VNTAEIGSWTSHRRDAGEGNTAQDDANSSSLAHVDVGPVKRVAEPREQLGGEETLPSLVVAESKLSRSTYY
jgi:hypothetical protein